MILKGIEKIRKGVNYLFYKRKGYHNMSLRGYIGI